MIKNEYLETFLNNNKLLSESDKEIHSHDEKHLINLQRPISQRGIFRLPKNTFKNFLEDIIKNKEVNELLYSGNAKKELSFSEKQTNFILKTTKFTFKKSAFSSAKNCQNIFYKKKRAEMFEIIKKNILESKKKKNERKIKLEKKNKSFENKNKKESKKQAELFLEKENEIKIKGYKRAMEACLDKSCLNKKFKIPDISLNINNVFSRLYNNVILEPLNITTRKNNENKKTETTNYMNKIEYKKINKVKIKESKIINRYHSYNNIGANNRYDKYKLKKILEGYEGKEFSRKENFIDTTKCIKKLSGGPKEKRKLYNKIIKKAIIQQNLNLIDKKFNVNSYRDRNKNSFLHIAIERNNEKFVKYLLNKNYTPNDQNIKGNTPMHISMKRKNRNIIKLLLDNNGNITIKNKEGLTSYDLADKDIKKEFKLENFLVLKKNGNKNY